LSTQERNELNEMLQTALDSALDDCHSLHLANITLQHTNAALLKENTCCINLTHATPQDYASEQDHTLVLRENSLLKQEVQVLRQLLQSQAGAVASDKADTGEKQAQHKTEEQVDDKTDESQEMQQNEQTRLLLLQDSNQQLDYTHTASDTRIQQLIGGSSRRVSMPKLPLHSLTSQTEASAPAIDCSLAHTSSAPCELLPTPVQHTPCNQLSDWPPCPSLHALRCVCV